MLSNSLKMFWLYSIEDLDELIVHKLKDHCVVPETHTNLKIFIFSKSGANLQKAFFLIKETEQQKRDGFIMLTLDKNEY